MEINEHIDENGKKHFRYGRKILYWKVHTMYVDIDTGEIIEKAEYKEHYKTIKKDEKTSYRNEYGHRRTIYAGRRKPNQLRLW